MPEITLIPACCSAHTVKERVFVNLIDKNTGEMMTWGVSPEIMKKLTSCATQAKECAEKKRKSIWYRLWLWLFRKQNEPAFILRINDKQYLVENLS